MRAVSLVSGNSEKVFVQSTYVIMLAIIPVMLKQFLAKTTVLFLRRVLDISAMSE